MKPTVTYSRSSPALIKCQVFYSKDTVKSGGVSIAEYIFADVTDVFGQDNTNACEGMSSISFDQRTLKSLGDYERKALWSRGVSRTPVFYPVSACVSRYLFSFMHSAQLMIDSRSHDTAFWRGWLKTESTGKSSHGHPHVPLYRVVLCVLGCTRAALMYSMCSSRFPSWCGRCESIYRWWSWLLIWTQSPRVHSSMVRAADCRSAGPWFNSGWRSWFIFMTGSDKSDESSRTAVQHYEPNQNSDHNDYKKVS